MILVESVFSTLNYDLLRQVLEIIDIGGALTVHLFGALFGGVFSLFFFFTKQEKERISNSPHLGTSYNSNIFALFGSLILLSYWPAFNTALIADQNILKYRGIINTYLSILGSIVATFCVSPLCNYGKLKIQDVLNACYSGGIVVAGCCHIINYHWVSLLIGVLSGALTTYLCNIISFRLKRKGYHDTSDVFLYHGIPGFLGGIFTTIFVGNIQNWKNREGGKIYNFTNDNFNETIVNFTGTLMSYTFTLNQYDNSIPRYAWTHFAAIFITLAIAATSGFVAGFTIKFCNCNIAIRYFNDSEFFDASDSEPFPWEDEQVELQVRYNSRT
jgi:ammonia channel protein AmtB